MKTYSIGVDCSEKHFWLAPKHENAMFKMGLALKSVDPNQLPNKKTAPGDPFHVIWGSLSAALHRATALAEKLLDLRWTTDRVGIRQLRYGPSSTEDVLHDVESLYYRMDKLIDDVAWLFTLFYDSKKSMSSCGIFKRFTRNKRKYYKPKVSIPANFLKHNQTELKSFEQFVYFDGHLQFLYGVSFRKLRERTSMQLFQPNSGILTFSLCAFLWVVLSVIFRLSDDIYQLVLSKQGKSAPTTNQISIEMTDMWRLIEIVLRLPVYAFEDRDVFDRNKFIFPESCSLRNDTDNTVFGSWFRPWSGSKRFGSGGQMLSMTPGITLEIGNTPYTLVHWRDA